MMYVLLPFLQGSCHLIWILSIAHQLYSILDFNHSWSWWTFGGLPFRSLVWQHHISNVYQSNFSDAVYYYCLVSSSSLLFFHFAIGWCWSHLCRRLYHYLFEKFKCYLLFVGFVGNVLMEATPLTQYPGTLNYSDPIDYSTNWGDALY